MKRLSIVALALVCLAAAGAAQIRPEIMSVGPPNPMPSRTAQPLVVTGQGFAAGLALSVTSPMGSVADYRGSAITDQRDASFRASVLLTDVGTYRLVVTNPDGQISTPFSLSVKAADDGPVIREIKPEGLRVSPTPQALTVEGARFDANLKVSVGDPTGNVQNLGGDAVRNVTPNAFQLMLTLETAGHYEVTVINPSGKSSNAAGFEVARAAVVR